MQASHPVPSSPFNVRSTIQCSDQHSKPIITDSKKNILKKQRSNPSPAAALIDVRNLPIARAHALREGEEEATDEQDAHNYCRLSGHSPGDAPTAQAKNPSGTAAAPEQPPKAGQEHAHTTSSLLMCSINPSPSTGSCHGLDVNVMAMVE
jgi:hypothetical protein